MVVVNVGENGIAPSGLRSGDYVNTAGGMYLITDPGEWGSSYNPASGYWSTPTWNNSDKMMQIYNERLAAARDASMYNSMMSQEFAREQMEFQSASNAAAMQFNANQAAKNRAFQAEMSSTAHQREVQDLIAAGLNPVLSAHGSGASTPSGASASGVTGSGAMGSVDTSYNALTTSLLETMINADTSTRIAKYQAQASMANAATAASATMQSTLLNARSNLEYQRRQNQFQEYVYQNYPQTYAGIISEILGAGSDLLSNNRSSANGVAQIVYKSLDAFSALRDLLKNDPDYKYRKYQ